MRSSILVALLAPLAVIASAASPPQAVDQLTFDNVKESVRNVISFDGDDDICPDLKVRCVIKDGTDSKVIGDVSFLDSPPQ